jgi:hypothetical protein
MAPFCTVTELLEPEPLPTFAPAPAPATNNWPPESNSVEFPLEPAPPTDSTPPQVITAELEITTEFPDAEERLPMSTAPLLDHNTLEPLSTSVPWEEEALLLPGTNWLLVTLASPTWTNPLVTTISAVPWSPIVARNEAALVMNNPAPGTVDEAKYSVSWALLLFPINSATGLDTPGLIGDSEFPSTFSVTVWLLLE